MIKWQEKMDIYDDGYDGDDDYDDDDEEDESWSLKACFLFCSMVVTGPEQSCHDPCDICGAFAKLGLA